MVKRERRPVYSWFDRKKGQLKPYSRISRDACSFRPKYTNAFTRRKFIGLPRHVYVASHLDKDEELCFIGQGILTTTLN